MPGPLLTQTDVAQRLRAFHEEPYASYPDKELREGCLTIYEQGKAEGTELPAIVGALQEFVELETTRRATARDEAWRRQRQEEQAALEQRFLAGADTKWTAIRGRPHIFTRKNGRTYRLARCAERWELFRIRDVSDTGALMGTYGTRGDATKALQKLAYEPEPRW